MGIPELLVVLPIAGVVIAIVFGALAVLRFFERQRRAVQALERAAAYLRPRSLPQPQLTRRARFRYAR